MRGQVARIPWSSISCQRDSTSCTGTRTGSTGLAAKCFIDIADVDHANAPVEIDWLTMGNVHGKTMTCP